MTQENSRILPSFDASKGLEVGIYSLGEWLPNPHTGKRTPASQRIQEIIEMARYAEEGLASDDIHFRLETLILETRQMAEAYQIIWRAEEEAYGF